MPPEPASATRPPASRREKKFFTLTEANRSLAYVARIVADLTDRYRVTLELRERLENPVADDRLEQVRDDYEHSMDRLGRLVEEIHQVGAEVKDFEKGLLDFPALHQGREICLCWHRGEERIRAWHELDAGYAGRQDVALLQQESENA